MSRNECRGVTVFLIVLSSMRVFLNSSQCLLTKFKGGCVLLLPWNGSELPQSERMLNSPVHQDLAQSHSVA